MPWPVPEHNGPFSHHLSRLFTTQVELSEPKVELSEPKVGLVDPKVELSEPKVGLVDPKVELSEPKVEPTYVLSKEKKPSKK